MVNSLPAMQKIWVQNLVWDGFLEKGKATHSSVLAWRIPGMAEPGGLLSMGLHRVGHDWSDLAAAAAAAILTPVLSSRHREVKQLAQSHTGSGGAETGAIWVQTSLQHHSAWPGGGGARLQGGGARLQGGGFVSTGDCSRWRSTGRWRLWSHDTQLFPLLIRVITAVCGVQYVLGLTLDLSCPYLA